jgi:hypothetical protein
VLRHLDDIASDMSVFHQVRDIWTVPGAWFFRMAYRLAAYEGVMRARVLAEQEEATPAQAEPHSAPYAPQRDINPGTKTALQVDPAFAGIFSFSGNTPQQPDGGGRGGQPDLRPDLRNASQQEYPELRP